MDSAAQCTTASTDNSSQSQEQLDPVVSQSETCPAPSTRSTSSIPAPPKAPVSEGGEPDFAIAVGLIEDAAAADKSGQYALALETYKKAIPILIALTKRAPPQEQKVFLRAKCSQILSRAEQIRDFIAGKDEVPEQQTWVADAPRKASDERELSAVERLVVRNSTTRFEDLAGMEAVKLFLTERIVIPSRFPQFFAGSRRPMFTNILLYGPPGCGKTLISQALANEASATLIVLSSCDAMTRWGDERSIRNTFALAIERQPSVVVIDEIDMFCDPNENFRRIKTELLVALQGLYQYPQVNVVATTNSPWRLDPAVRRRFEQRVFCPLPDEAARVQLLQQQILLTRARYDQVDCQQLAGLTGGYTFSDLINLVRDATMEPIREISRSSFFRRVMAPRRDDPDRMVEHWTPCVQEDGGAEAHAFADLCGPDAQLLERPVTMTDMQAILSRSRPSIDHAYMAQLEAWTREFV